MLRTALAERLSLQYHLTKRETNVYLLVRGAGNLKLSPSIQPEPQSLQSAWLFRNKSAALSDFARFLSSVVHTEVIDKTGIPGAYEFDVDWRDLLEDDPQNNGPGIALMGVKRLGLKLETGKEMRNILVVDRSNRKPTPN
jgi:uncharacterized protein (TIGR03435 family)